MTQTTYRRRTPTSTYTVRKKEAGDPVRELTQKLCGRYELLAVVEEDVTTLTTMKETENLVAFVCTLLKNNRVLAQGRGAAVYNPRFISRGISSAFNSSISDAVLRATRVLDTFRDKPEGDAVEETRGAPVSERISEKQRAYLSRLLQEIEDEATRDKWMANLDSLSRDEASAAISRFSNR